MKQDIFQVVFPAVYHSITIFYGTEAHLDDICAYSFLDTINSIYF